MGKALADFIKEHQLTMRSQRVERRTDGAMSDMGKGARHFLCTIVQEGKGPCEPMALFYSQGSAHTKGPTLVDVLDCLASDAASVLNARHFEDWCAELGYDTDSRKAEETYRTCQDIVRKLERLLGRQAVQELAFEMERL